MLITNKTSKQIPDYIIIKNRQVKLVNDFKLLGIKNAF